MHGWHLLDRRCNQLRRDMPEIKYIIASEGGEIWTDFYVVPKDAPHREAAMPL